ncbi:MAG: mechanosensitive ion channel [Firmicutes bacterium]|nr:mechanosensitive ion channel [Bacillota bacterium]
METIKKLINDNWNEIIRFLIILVIGYILIKITLFFFNKSKSIIKIDPTISGILRGIIKFFLYASYVIILLNVLGVPITTFIAMFGAVGLAVALALQGNLSNFASAFIILMFKPFKVGDYIESKDKSGTVNDIQMLYTQLLTPDNRKIIIPNSELVNSSVINYTSEPIRRVDLVFNASYDSDVDKVKNVLNNIVIDHKKILEFPEAIVRLANHGASSLDYDVKVWVDTMDYWDVLYDLEETVRKKFKENNIDIPFPQSEIYLKYVHDKDSDKENNKLE